MPIVDIEMVLKPDETISNEMVSELADRLGVIFDSPRHGTWVKVYGIPEGLYTENGGKEESIYPIFVSVLKAQWPTLEDMQREVDKITETVAQLCNRTANLVHVIYQPEGKGRVAFGGKIVE
jgi:hypothetical protein